MNEQILQMPMHVLLLVHKGNRVTEIHNLGKEGSSQSTELCTTKFTLLHVWTQHNFFLIDL